MKWRYYIHQGRIIYGREIHRGVQAYESREEAERAQLLRELERERAEMRAEMQEALQRDRHRFGHESADL